MATINLYEDDNLPGWLGNTSAYELICEHALRHGALERYPSIASAVEKSLWYKNLDLYEHEIEEIGAFGETVADLLNFIQSPEGAVYWEADQKGAYNRVRMLYDLLAREVVLPPVPDLAEQKEQ
jgi:hypothetical protein